MIPDLERLAADISALFFVPRRAQSMSALGKKDQAVIDVHFSVVRGSFFIRGGVSDKTRTSDYFGASGERSQSFGWGWR